MAGKKQAETAQDQIGHIISSNNIDDSDIQREITNMLFEQTF